MRRMVRTVSAGGVVLFLACGRQGAVDLSLDFSGRSQWRYSFALSISGSAPAVGGMDSFSMQSTGILRGVGSTVDPSLVTLQPESAAVTADFLDEAETANLRSQLLSAHASFSMKGADIRPLHSIDLPVISIGEWNLYTTLIKVLPSLPDMRVRPGATWDRERRFPLETTFGSATGQVFQHFSFDSLSTGPEGVRRAAVSWRYSYSINPLDADSALGRLPLKGKGTGRALLNVTDRCLVEAMTRFGVPDADTTGPARWRETIHLRALDDPRADG